MGFDAFASRYAAVVALIERTFVTLVRERRAGTAFVDAWTAALAELPPARTRDARDELEALQATASAWRRAFEREPATPGEAAAGRLATTDFALDE